MSLGCGNFGSYCLHEIERTIVFEAKKVKIKVVWSFSEVATILYRTFISVYGVIKIITAGVY